MVLICTLKASYEKVPTVDLGEVFQPALDIQGHKPPCFRNHCWQRRDEAPRHHWSTPILSGLDRFTTTTSPGPRECKNNGNPSCDSSKLWKRPLVCSEWKLQWGRMGSSDLFCCMLKCTKCNSAQRISVSHLRTIVFNCFPLLLPQQVFCCSNSSKWMSIWPHKYTHQIPFTWPSTDLLQVTAG